jgi:hypothetical protein
VSGNDASLDLVAATVDSCGPGLIPAVKGLGISFAKFDLSPQGAARVRGFNGEFGDALESLGGPDLEQLHVS